MAGGGRAPGQPVSRGSTFPAAGRAGVRRWSSGGPGSGRLRAGLLGAAAERRGGGIRGWGGCGARVRALACPCGSRWVHACPGAAAAPALSPRVPARPGWDPGRRARGPRRLLTARRGESSLQRCREGPSAGPGHRSALDVRRRQARGVGVGAGPPRPAGPRGLGGAVRQPRARPPRRPARGLSRVSRFPWPLRGLLRGPGPGGRRGWLPRGAIGRPRGGDCDSADPRPFRDHRDSPGRGREELRRPSRAWSCPWLICGVLGPRPLKERGVCVGGRGPSLQPRSLESGGAPLRAAPPLSEPRPVLRVCAGWAEPRSSGPGELAQAGPLAPC